MIPTSLATEGASPSFVRVARVNPEELGESSRDDHLLKRLGAEVKRQGFPDVVCLTDEVGSELLRQLSLWSGDVWLAARSEPYKVFTEGDCTYLVHARGGATALPDLAPVVTPKDDSGPDGTSSSQVSAKASAPPPSPNARRQCAVVGFAMAVVVAAAWAAAASSLAARATRS